jgi:hypothetical protein
MDWQTILTVVIVAVVFFVMIRGCGGMARGGGCCGMGSQRHLNDDGETQCDQREQGSTS